MLIREIKLPGSVASVIPKIAKFVFAAVACCAPALHAEAIPVVLVTAPAALEQLEQSGFSFPALVFDADAGIDNARLHDISAYRSIVSVIGADLDRLRTKDPALGVGMGFGHRLFDQRWLRSPSARFELVGVVNRIDRAPFSSEGCGEVRFVYRLAYQQTGRGGRVYSRLPFTANVVFWARDADGKRDCRASARRWPSAADADGAVVEFLRSSDGALAPLLVSLANLKSVEVNLQSVRWPSTIRPNMGGHAEYVLRVFHRDPETGAFVAASLENTPDVESLKRKPEVKRKLLSWLKDPANLRRIDAGTAVIPEEFLARRATSFALHGSARLANRPFTRLFQSRDFADLDYSRLRRIGSPRALLRRLDDLSCTGCHQTRTVAGFHLLGVDGPETDPVNAIHASSSPHLVLDLARRARYVRALRDEREPEDRRPLSERADDGEGGFGAHCGLAGSAFTDWSCNAGLACRQADGGKNEGIGECLPESPVTAGDPCQLGAVEESEDPYRDRITGVERRSCGAGAVCEAVAVGFPGGMCSAGCDDLGGDEVCGSIAILDGFNRCLASGRPFGECTRQNVRPAALRRCDARTPCRDDYICSRTLAGEGACIPPYFLFQLRVDGHPTPR